MTQKNTCDQAYNADCQQLRDLAERIPVGIYLFRMPAQGPFRFDYVSPRFCEFFDVDAQTLQIDAASAFNKVHPEESEAFKQKNLRAKQTLEPFVWEGRFVVRGQVRWFLIESTPSPQANGDSLWSGMVMDHTERKQMTERLQDSELALKHLNESLEELVFQRTAELRKQMFRNEMILRTAIDGFFAVDLSGHIFECNPAFCDMLGYTRSEILSMTLQDIEANENPEDIARHIDRVLAVGEDRFDTRHRRKDGRVIDVEISVKYVEIGQRRKFYAFVRDIGQREQVKAALLQALASAEQANLAKSEFLSRMSHELRTPLNAILGFTQLLQSDPALSVNSQHQQNLQEIAYAGEHLLTLVDEVLDLSRIESGQLQLNLEPLLLEPLLDSCLAQLKPMLLSRQISVNLSPMPAYPVWADSLRLKQVLLNLLGNAIKFNKEAGQIHVHCQLQSAQRLRVSIQDEGYGISVNVLPRLFLPFERLESPYHGTAGSGIGLAIAKKLLDAMHGQIGVDSVEGQGARFWFELPLASAPIDSPPMLPAHQYQVLYIEDNPGNLQLVQKILAKRCDLQLLTANNGTEGLAMARQRQPDLILLDLHLPDISGFEVLQQLKAQAETQHIPVIALTADAMRGDSQRGKSAGFLDYLIKPLDLKQFLATIDRTLQINMETSV